MSQWEKLLDLGLVQGRLDLLYDGKFPRHVRHSLCSCIEAHDWASAAMDPGRASACLQALLLHVDKQWERAVQRGLGLEGPDYPGIKDFLVRHFKDEPLKLAAILSECLQEEKKALASASEDQGCADGEETWKEMDNRVEELRRQTVDLEKDIMYLDALYQNQSKAGQLVGSADAHAEERCRRDATQLVLTKTVQRLTLAKQVVSGLLGAELPRWKRRQQMACIGSPADAGLDDLQKWFTAVAGVLLQIRQRLLGLLDHDRKCRSPDATGLHGDAVNITESLLTKLLASALVVEKQPVMSNFPKRPLVIKTGNSFTAAVRFLANLPEFNCRIKVQPVFDKDSKETTMKGRRQFVLEMDHSKVLDVGTDDGGLVVEFELKLLKHTRMRGKGLCEGRLGVSEELHTVQFVGGFQFDGLSCDLEACALPVLVITSTNQLSSAWATVLWSNLLSTGEPQPLLMADPPPLAWQQLSEALSWQFLSVGQRGLNESQLNELRHKLVDNPEGYVHWAKFKNENVWTWIDGVLDLIQRHLLDLWRDGCIMGFMSRKRTELLLKEMPTGTFLLRFSESIIDGAVSFSWVEHGIGEAHVYAVDPYTKKDLNSLSLADSICQYSLKDQDSWKPNPLLHLYPGIPREEAFGRYCTLGPKKKNGGYIPRNSIPPDYPTPPQSPTCLMDVDPDPDTEDFQQLLEFLGHK